MEKIWKKKIAEKQVPEARNELDESQQPMLSSIKGNLKTGKDAVKSSTMKKGDEVDSKCVKKRMSREIAIIEGKLSVHSQTFFKQEKQKAHYFYLFPTSKLGRARLLQYASDASASDKFVKEELMLLAPDVVKVEDLASPDGEGDEELTFLIQSKDHNLVLSAPSSKEKHQWISAIQETLLRDCDSPTRNVHHQFSSSENITLPRAFKVRISKKTQVRIGDDSPVDLVVDAGSLSAIASNKVRLVKWPMIMLRRYGFTNSTFYVEAGKNTEAGEGEYVFLTEEGEEIHRTVKAAKRSHSTDGEHSRASQHRPSPPPSFGQIYADDIYEPVESEVFRNAPALKQSKPSLPSAPTHPRKNMLPSLPTSCGGTDSGPSSSFHNPQYDFTHRKTFSEGLSVRVLPRNISESEFKSNRDISKSVTAFPIVPRRVPIVDTIVDDEGATTDPISQEQFQKNVTVESQPVHNSPTSQPKVSIPQRPSRKLSLQPVGQKGSRNEQSQLEIQDDTSAQNTEAVYAEVDRSKKTKKQ